MIGYVGVEEQVDKDFHRARRRAFLHRLGDWLRRDVAHERLPSFDEAKGALAKWSQAYRGMRTVDVEKIKGSVGRCGDFDEDFLPLKLAEDHPLFRKGMVFLLSSVPEFEVVGEAATGEEAITRAMNLQPDVILMDLQMPEVNGIEATKRILQDNPSIRILVVTLFEDDDSVFAALRAGARGYVLKDADEEEMVLSIRAVGRGEAIFSPAIAERVLAYFASPMPAPPQAFPTLTDREREILNLIAQGHPNPSIARQLSLSTKTVGNYVSNIFTKLQVADRAQAIIRAREAGMG